MQGIFSSDCSLNLPEMHYLLLFLVEIESYIINNRDTITVYKSRRFIEHSEHSIIPNGVRVYVSHKYNHESPRSYY